MRAFLVRLSAIISCWLTNTYSPARAHVKWFLSRPEAELLKQPKPPLFNHFSFDNLLPLLLSAGAMLIAYALNVKAKRWTGPKRLIALAKKHEASINLLMAIGLGSSLIYCGITHTLLVPNFIICSHCPKWLPPAQMIIGAFLLIGFVSRLSALSVFALIFMAVSKHGIGDGLDLLPLAGLAFYFLIAGRNKFSLDNILSIDKFADYSLTQSGHAIVRWCVGFGLIVLALDEKLWHPQLAMDLLQHSHTLNILQSFGVSNAKFILISGLGELMLGLSILLGIFPRLAVMAVLCIFAATTEVFGLKEFFGHTSCYSIILSILLWGDDAQTSFSTVLICLRQTFARLIIRVKTTSATLIAEVRRISKCNIDKLAKAK